MVSSHQALPGPITPGHSLGHLQLMLCFGIISSVSKPGVGRTDWTHQGASIRWGIPPNRQDFHVLKEREKAAVHTGQQAAQQLCMPHMPSSPSLKQSSKFPANSRKQENLHAYWILSLAIWQVSTGYPTRYDHA